MRTKMVPIFGGLSCTCIYCYRSFPPLIDTSLPGRACLEQERDELEVEVGSASDGQ